MLMKGLAQEQQTHCCLFQFILELSLCFPWLEIIFFFYIQIALKLLQRKIKYFSFALLSPALSCVVIQKTDFRSAFHAVCVETKHPATAFAFCVCQREHEPLGKGEHRRLFCPDFKEIHFSQRINSDCTMAGLKCLVLVCVCFLARISRGFN